MQCGWTGLDWTSRAGPVRAKERIWAGRASRAGPGRGSRQRTPPPHVWQHNLRYLREISYCMVRMPFLCEKARGKPVWLRNHHM